MNKKLTVDLDLAITTIKMIYSLLLYTIHSANLLDGEMSVYRQSYSKIKPDDLLNSRYRLGISFLNSYIHA